MESNSECNRHVYLSYTLANSHLAIVLLVSTWPGCSCGRGVRARQLCGYVFLVHVLCGKICKMVLYTELFYAIIPACFHTFAVLLSLHLHTFLMFFTLVLYRCAYARTCVTCVIYRHPALSLSTQRVISLLNESLLQVTACCSNAC